MNKKNGKKIIIYSYVVEMSSEMDVFIQKIRCFLCVKEVSANTHHVGKINEAQLLRVDCLLF